MSGLRDTAWRFTPGDARAQGAERAVAAATKELEALSANAVAGGLDPRPQFP